MISVMILPHVKILVYVSQKTWDTNVIVKMVSDKYVSVIQNSCVTKDMGYTFDCKDGE